MNEKERVGLSKFLSWVLRHEPGAIGLALDAQGWVEIDELIEKARDHQGIISRADLAEVVATSPKQRFAISEDGRRIRANQGHSISIDLGYTPAVPPDVLFHGTTATSLSAIRAEGLRKMARHHVHLSRDAETAHLVGARRGESVVLRIDARGMREAGHLFYVSVNGVWLTQRVPAEFIDFP
jgi:putative RNA 2'-phosphotransferase